MFSNVLQTLRLNFFPSLTEDEIKRILHQEKKKKFTVSYRPNLAPIILKQHCIMEKNGETILTCSFTECITQ